MYDKSLYSEDLLLVMQCDGLVTEEIKERIIQNIKKDFATPFGIGETTRKEVKGGYSEKKLISARLMLPFILALDKYNEEMSGKQIEYKPVDSILPVEFISTDFVQKELDFYSGNLISYLLRHGILPYGFSIKTYEPLSNQTDTVAISGMLQILGLLNDKVHDNIPVNKSPELTNPELIQSMLSAL